MEHVGAPEKGVDVEVPERISGIDWYLVGTDSTAGCLFVAGLFALLVGLSALGLGLWAACVWLDWRVLAYLRASPADAVHLRQYVNRRVTTNGIAQVLAIVLGLYLATSGHPWLAFGIWVVAAGGIVCSRMLSASGALLGRTGSAPGFP
jgi:hypothetical protein